MRRSLDPSISRSFCRICNQYIRRSFERVFRCCIVDQSRSATYLRRFRDKSALYYYVQCILRMPSAICSSIRIKLAGSAGRRVRSSPSFSVRIIIPGFGPSIKTLFPSGRGARVSHQRSDRGRAVGSARCRTETAATDGFVEYVGTKLEQARQSI